MTRVGLSVLWLAVCLNHGAGCSPSPNAPVPIIADQSPPASASNEVELPAMHTPPTTFRSSLGPAIPRPLYRMELQEVSIPKPIEWREDSGETQIFWDNAGYTIAFADSGKVLLIGGTDGQIAQIDLESRACHTFKSGDHGVTSLDVSRDGRFVFVGYGDYPKGYIVKWQLPLQAQTSAAVVMCKDVPVHVSDITGDLVVLAEKNGAEPLALWDVANRTTRTILRSRDVDPTAEKHFVTIKGALYLPDSQELIVGTNYGLVATSLGKPDGEYTWRRFSKISYGHKISAAPGERDIFTVGNDVIVRINLNSLTATELPIVPSPHPWPPSLAAVSPDGKFVATVINAGNKDNSSVYLLDRKTWKVLTQCLTDVGPALGLCFSQDGRRLAVIRYRSLTAWVYTIPENP